MGKNTSQKSFSDKFTENIMDYWYIAHKKKIFLMV